MENNELLEEIRRTYEEIKEKREEMENLYKESKKRKISLGEMKDKVPSKYTITGKRTLKSGVLTMSDENKGKHGFKMSVFRNRITTCLGRSKKDRMIAEEYKAKLEELTQDESLQESDKDAVKTILEPLKESFARSERAKERAAARKAAKEQAAKEQASQGGASQGITAQGQATQGQAAQGQAAQGGAAQGQTVQGEATQEKSDEVETVGIFYPSGEPETKRRRKASGPYKITIGRKITITTPNGKTEIIKMNEGKIKREVQKYLDTVSEVNNQTMMSIASKADKMCREGQVDSRLLYAISKALPIRKVSRYSNRAENQDAVKSILQQIVGEDDKSAEKSKNLLEITIDYDDMSRTFIPGKYRKCAETFSEMLREKESCSKWITTKGSYSEHTISEKLKAIFGSASKEEEENQGRKSNNRKGTSRENFTDGLKVTTEKRTKTAVGKNGENKQLGGVADSYLKNLTANLNNNYGFYK